jgi:hypothetical protein
MVRDYAGVDASRIVGRWDRLDVDSPFVDSRRCCIDAVFTALAVEDLQSAIKMPMFGLAGGLLLGRLRLVLSGADAPHEGLHGFRSGSGGDGREAVSLVVMSEGVGSGFDQ